MTRWILDLCSGMGGASQPFVDRIEREVVDMAPEWGVIRVEINPKFSLIPFTRQLDVLEWMDWIEDLPEIEAVWASPPCTDFSLAANAHRPRPQDPDVAILEACIAIIDHLKPRIWTLENVRGAIRYFRPIIGEPSQIIGPFYLWGRFPALPVTEDFRGLKTESRDPAIRSMIPPQLAEAWYGVVALQHSLGDFL